MKKSILSSLLLFGLIAVAPRAIYAQESCTPLVLQNATRAYEFGRFNEAFGLLNPCVPSGFSAKADQTEAYRLLALSQLALDSPTTARDLTRQLLQIDSSYRANSATDPLMFVQMVDDLRPKWHTWMYRGNGWKSWTGRTLLVGAIVSVPLLLQTDPVPDLPPPPSFPGAN